MTENEHRGSLKVDQKLLGGVLLLMLATAFSMALHGFDFPISNNIFHVPIVLDYANSLEGPADVYHNSLSNFVSGFWVTLSHFVTEGNIYYVFLGLTVFFRFFTIFMVWILVTTLTERTMLSAILCSFILFFDTFLGVSPVGFNEVFVNYLTHSQAVIPFVLCSWFFILKRKYVIAAGVLGVAFCINAFVGVWGGLVAGCTFLYIHRDQNIRFLAKRSLQMLLVFTLIASPVLVWALSTVFTDAASPEFNFGEYLLDYYPHHSYISTHVRDTIAFVFLVTCGFLLLERLVSGSLGKYRETLFCILGLYTCILVFGAFLPYVTDSRLLLNLYPLRSDTYVLFLLAVLVLSWAAHTLRTGDIRKLASPLIALFSLFNGNVLLLSFALMLNGEQGHETKRRVFLRSGFLIVVGITHLVFNQAPILSPQHGIQAVFCILTQVGIICFSHVKSLGEIRTAATLVSAAILGILPPTTTIPELGMVAWLYLVMLVSVTSSYKTQLSASITLVSACVSLLLLRNELHWQATTIVGASIALVLYWAGKFRCHKLVSLFLSERVVYPALLISFCILSLAQLGIRGSLSQDAAAAHASSEAQEWARHNTAPHATFLAVGVDGFATLSRRPVWVDWKSGAVVMWAPETYEIWATRIAKLRAVNDTSGAINLAKNECLEFIVLFKKTMSADSVLEPHVAFENESFLIANVSDLLPKSCEL